MWFHHFIYTFIDAFSTHLCALSLTSLFCVFFQRSHLVKPWRQYSTTYASVYSWPWPRPNRPCERIAVIACICSKSICKYSFSPRDTICFGHHAPPLLSTFNLQTENIAKWKHTAFNFMLFNSYSRLSLTCYYWKRRTLNMVWLQANSDRIYDKNQSNYKERKGKHVEIYSILLIDSDGLWR